jgi:hypothetical protein
VFYVPAQRATGETADEFVRIELCIELDANAS